MCVHARINVPEFMCVGVGVCVCECECETEMDGVSSLKTKVKCHTCLSQHTCPR